jgi:hypothetical protein
MAPTLRQITLGLAGGAGGCLPVARRLQFHPRAPGLRESDSNGLLGRRRTMLAFSHMVHFLAHEFSRLCAGRFSFAGILASAFDGFAFRHIRPPLLFLSAA